MLKKIKGFAKGLWIGVKRIKEIAIAGYHLDYDSLPKLMDTSGYDPEVRTGIDLIISLFPYIIAIIVWEIIKKLIKKVKK